MQSVSNILLDNEILLESGTNELEILVFRVANYTFGINVAKVREVLPAPEITGVPRAHRSVRGVFKLRDRVIPVVSLVEHLEIEGAGPDGEQTAILTDLNLQQTAFLVDEVEKIHRLSWQQILGVPPVLAGARTPVTGLARCENRLIVMLDFELILDQVIGRDVNRTRVENPHGLEREQLRLILADDSASVREAMTQTLAASGYTRVRTFENGQACWNWLEHQVREKGSADLVADLLISDVEMPQMDGFHLTKRVKEHPLLKQVPVLLYSSIVTPDNYKKGAAVGADAQISKPELSKAVQLADELILKRRQASLGAVAVTPANTVEVPVAAPAPAAPTSAPQPVAVPQPVAAAKPVDEIKPAAAPPLVSAALPRPAPAAQVQATATLPAAEPGLGGTARSFGPAPAGVSERLWQTYRIELVEREECLEALVTAASQVSGDARTTAQNDLMRLLHSIKSAAMVLPVDAVTRTTHLMESLLSHLTDAQDWPQHELAAYSEWLQKLAYHSGDVSDILAEGATLEAELAESLARRSA